MRKMCMCEHRSVRLVIPPRGWFAPLVEDFFICNNPHCQAIGVRFAGDRSIHWRSAGGQVELAPEKGISRRHGAGARERRKAKG